MHRLLFDKAYITKLIELMNDQACVLFQIRNSQDFLGSTEVRVATQRRYYSLVTPVEISVTEACHTPSLHTVITNYLMLNRSDNHYYLRYGKTGTIACNATACFLYYIYNSISNSYYH